MPSIDVSGEPGPLSEQRMDRVRRALKELDPLLDIRWVPMARWNPRQQKMDGRYALICRWPEIDDRWEMFHSGEIGEPFDVIGYYEVSAGSGEMDWFSGNGEPVDPSIVMDRTLALLASCDNTRQSWKERVRKSAEHNRRLREKRKQEVVDETVQGMKHYRKKIRGEPIVALGEALSDSDPTTNQED